MSSYDNLSKHVYPDQARHNVGPDLDPNCLTPTSFLKVFKKMILKKKSLDDKKSMDNYPVGKQLGFIRWLYNWTFKYSDVSSKRSFEWE